MGKVISIVLITLGSSWIESTSLRQVPFLKRIFGRCAYSTLFLFRYEDLLGWKPSLLLVLPCAFHVSKNAYRCTLLSYLTHI